MSKFICIYDLGHGEAIYSGKTLKEAWKRLCEEYDEVEPEECTFYEIGKLPALEIKVTRVDITIEKA